MRRTPQSSAHGVGDLERTWKGLTAQFVPLGDGARALGLRPGQLADAARRAGVQLVFMGSGGQRTRVLHLGDFERLAAALTEGRLGNLHVRRRRVDQASESDATDTSENGETVMQQTTATRPTHTELTGATYVAIDTAAAAIAVTDDAPTKISLADTPVTLDETLVAKLEGELEIMRQAYQEQIAALHASQTNAAALGRTGAEFEQAAEEAHTERMQFERELILARGRIQELEQRTAELTAACEKARAAIAPASSISTSALRAIEEQRDAATAAVAQEREKCQEAREELQAVRTEGSRLARELKIVQDGYKSQVRQLEASHDISGHSERMLRDLRATSEQEAADLNRALVNERNRAAAMEHSLVQREDEVAHLAERLELSETECRRQADELITGTSHATETREQLSRMSARAQAAMTRVSGLQQELAESRSEAEKLASRLRVEEVKRTILTRRLGEAATRLRELHAFEQTVRRTA